MREQVIAAIIESHVSNQNVPVRSLDTSASLHASSGPGVTTAASAEHASSANDPGQISPVVTDIDLQSTLVSPLHILAAAVTSDGTPTHQSLGSDIMPSVQNPAIRNQAVCPIDVRLMRYFGKITPVSCRMRTQHSLILIVQCRKQPTIAIGISWPLSQLTVR